MTINQRNENKTHSFFRKQFITFIHSSCVRQKKDSTNKIKSNRFLYDLQADHFIDVFLLQVHRSEIGQVRSMMEKILWPGVHLILYKVPMKFNHTQH